MDSQRSELRASGGPAFVPPLSGEGQDSVQRVAVVDIGSNSVRLVVYETGTGLPSVLYNEKVHCGLGRGLSETGALNREGMQKALASLERFVALSRAMGVSFLELVATAAVRDAQDGADFAVLVSALPPPEPLSDEPEDPPAGEEPESLEPESPDPDSFDAASAACLALLAERVP